MGRTSASVNCVRKHVPSLEIADVVGSITCPRELDLAELVALLETLPTITSVRAGGQPLVPITVCP